MTRITFLQKVGNSKVVLGESGSLMQLAVSHGVKGIEGQCGGFCACGTCHVHLSDAWLAQLGAASDAEMAMLEFEPDTTANSRLCCQIQISPTLDGLSMTVARAA